MNTFGHRITDDTGAFASIIFSIVCGALISISVVVQVTTTHRPQPAPITLEELAITFDARTE